MKITLVFKKVMPCYLIFIALLLNPLYADDKLDEKQAEMLASKIYSSYLSPFCPGRLIKDCPSEQASLLKKEIKEKLKKGMPLKKIEEELISKYGEEIRGVPKTKGIQLLAWALPFIFLLGGFVVILKLIKN